jgi:hypothetical protein
MTTCEKETRAIKFGKFVTYIVRTKLVKWGKKRGENPNGTKPFPNWHAKKITGGSREGSLQVGSDEVLSCAARTSCNGSPIMLSHECMYVSSSHS